MTSIPHPSPIPTVALAGNPNSGKTTLFNALTGLRQHVANYPGVTVEKKTGRAVVAGRLIDVIDLPGTYSLVPASPDERVAMEVLRGLRADTPRPDALIAVVDASNLARNLFLFSQLSELGLPLVVALNMTDVAERRGARIDAAALATALGVPVIPVVGSQGTGIDTLRAAIERALATGPDALPAPWASVEALEREIAPLSAFCGASPVSARRLLLDDPSPDLDRLRADPGVKPHLEAARTRLAAARTDAVQADIEARYRWIDGVVARCVVAGPATPSLTERADAVLLNPVLGLGIFALIMASLFAAIFLIAAPVKEVLDAGMDWLGGNLTAWIGPGLLTDLLKDGVIAGVGGVVGFVPQIVLLFAFLALLEDSGYLARAAFLMDRLLARIGLHGKSFIPLLSSFACAIPAILATRTIDGRRERLATILVAPFMSCSARLPVYGLMIETFFAPWAWWQKGLLLMGAYVLGILAAVFTALAVRLFARIGAATPFILELPTYQVPQAKQVTLAVWGKTREFLVRAGTIIFALSVVLWALATFPGLPAEREAAIRASVTVAAPAAPIPATVPAPGPQSTFPDPGKPVAAAVAPGQGTDAAKTAAAEADRKVAAAALEHSLAGRLGHVIEPVIAPLGFDWKTGIGLVGAFAAREVFVSTMGIVHSVGDGEDTQNLQQALRSDHHPDGRPVWTTLTAISLLVWFVLAMQCVSTTAVVRRETGGWAWPLVQIGYMNALAWIVCFAVFQLGLRLGFGG